jgi:ELWxxDGT repeat protein
MNPFPKLTCWLILLVLLSSRIFVSQAQEQVRSGSLQGFLPIGVEDLHDNVKRHLQFDGQGGQGSRPIPYLVKEIYPGKAGAFPTLDYVRPLMPVGDTLYLIANNGTTGPGLWKSNGTAVGTTLVTAIHPNATAWSVLDGLLYFDAIDSEGNTGLWKTDGTAAGTTLIKAYGYGDILTAYDFESVNGLLYFGLYDGVTGVELWKSDGTAEGTMKIHAGSPAWLTNVEGTLYFVDTYDLHEGSLWKSDGTVTGTVQLKAFTQPDPPASNYYPAWLTVLHGTLYFTAYDDTHGFELWKSDGTAEGTVLLKDINPGPNGSSIEGMIESNGALYFSATDGTHGQSLWKSDGTAEGTVLLKDINPGAGGAFPSFSGFVSMNNLLYFSANDGVSGNELWKSDGTTEGTVRVKDINPGAGDALTARGFDFLTPVQGTLYFAATDGVTGVELWQSDGTEAGTIQVSDIHPGPGNAMPSFLTNVNGLLYFAADDGVTGMELWAVNPKLTQHRYLPLVHHAP